MYATRICDQSMNDILLDIAIVTTRIVIRFLKRCHSLIIFNYIENYHYQIALTEKDVLLDLLRGEGGELRGGPGPGHHGGEHLDLAQQVRVACRGPAGSSGSRRPARGRSALA